MKMLPRPRETANVRSVVGKVARQIGRESQVCRSRLVSQWVSEPRRWWHDRGGTNGSYDGETEEG